MKFRVPFAVASSLCFLLFPGANAQQGEKQKPSTGVAIREAKVVSAVRLDSVKILSQPGSPMIDKPAPQGDIWLCLTVEFEFPKGGTSLVPSSIRVLNGSSKTHPAVGIEVAKPIGDEHAFHLFEDLRLLPSGAAGIGKVDEGVLQFSITRTKSEPEMEFYMGRVKILLLFTVPSGADRLYFQVGEAGRTAVPPTGQESSAKRTK